MLLFVGIFKTFHMVINFSESFTEKHMKETGYLFLSPMGRVYKF